MILKALCDYYDRCKDSLPSFGLELKEIAFVIVINSSGQFVRFEDRRIDKKRAQSFLVAKHVGRSSAPVANYLYDNSAYVFGYSDKSDMNACKKSFDTFKKKIEELYLALPTSPDLLALNRFYQQTSDMMVDAMKKDPLWPDIEKNLSKKYSTFSFMLEGDVRIIAEKQELLGLINEDSSSDKQVCLISGKNETIVETTTATMIPGSQATAKLVAFQVKSGYDSYGKEKGKNAPIGETSEFAYTTALNHMLSSDSRNKFTIGSRTYLFWASSNNEACSQAEDCIFNMFGFNQNEDNPNKQIEQVHKVFKAIYSGMLETSLDDKFYILGLAPNSARIAVVYWAEIQLKKFAGLISRHFDDMEIVDRRPEKFPYMGLKSILGAVTLGGKSNDATPNLPDAVVKSIFQGLPYPYTLFAGCIRRIRAEQSIKITRAAIIKAYLNRLDNKEQKIKVMLDKENRNQGYLCGRLFAVLEKIQEEANKQHSIRERYMNSASATPAIVFPTILNLSSHHSEKLSEGRNVWFEKLKQEIVDKISSNGFPVHLDLQDQGRFFVGYYHQRQDFFEKKSDKNENE